MRSSRVDRSWTGVTTEDRLASAHRAGTWTFRGMGEHLLRKAYRHVVADEVQHLRLVD
jgi:hypothetical protein